MRHLTRICSTLALLTLATTAHALATYSVDSEGDGYVLQDFQATPAYMATLAIDRAALYGHPNATAHMLDSGTWVVEWVVGTNGSRTTKDVVFCQPNDGGGCSVFGRREYVTSVEGPPYALVAWEQSAERLADVTIVINACLR